MLDNLTLDQISVFVTIAESGSFRAAAARLARVQSAVSHAVANLEAEFGLTLFDRSGHRPALTAEGNALLSNARDLLLRVDAMRARARGLGDGVESELSVIVDTLFPIATVGAALAEMRAAYPSVGVRLAVEPMGGPIEAVTERRSALAVTVGEDFRDPRLALDAICAVQIARNDARHVISFSRRVSPELCLSSRPLWKQRARGMPGARCTHGLVCKGREKKRTRAYRFSGRHSGIPCAMALRLMRAHPGETGLFCHRARQAATRLARDTCREGVRPARFRRPHRHVRLVRRSGHRISPQHP
jgi:DNA-binding transcriptional LysR family regulator